MKFLLQRTLQVILLSCLSMAAFAQQSVLRKEFEAHLRTDYFKVIPAGKHGILVLSGDARSQAQNQEWEVIMYDTEFNELWSKSVSIYGTLAMQSWYLVEDHLYVLLGSTKTGKYSVIDVDFPEKTIRQSNGFLRMKGNWLNIYAKDNVVICPFEVKKGFFLNLVNMSNGASSFVPIKTKGKYDLMDANLAEGSDEICMAYNFTQGGQVATHLAWADLEGRVQRDLSVEYLGDERINTATATKVSDEMTIITGTYNNWNRPGNQGMFFGVVEGGKVKTLKYHSFTVFENFFSYLPERTQERIEKKIEKRQSKGADLKLNYRLLTHPVKRLGDNFLTLSEAYYPEYHTQYRTVMVNGIPTTTTVQVFDGYRYTHAVLGCFDANGNLIWDHCFPIWNILTFDLKRYVRLGITDDDEVDIVLAYGSKIKSMIVKDGEVKKDVSVDFLETLNESDRVRWTASAGVEHWYDDYYVAFGFSKIVNNEERGPDRKRWVFYFNKIAL